MLARARIVALATTVILVVSLAAPPLTSAATNARCQDFPLNNWWQGQQSGSGSTLRHGIKATVENQVLKQCFDPGFPEFSGSFIWVNIVPTNGGFNDIIQVGVGVCRGGIECNEAMHFQGARGRENTTPGCAGYSNEWPIGHKYYFWNPGTHVLELKHQTNA